MVAAPLFLSSGDLIADRRYDHARALEQRGDLEAAAELLLQAIEQAPKFVSAWFALGEIRERTGDCDGAIEAFAAVLANDRDDRLGAALRLIRLGVAAGNEQIWSVHIRTLFDQYAPRFDEALIERLDYRGPELLVAAVTDLARGKAAPAFFESMLDLGCGTGLAGAVFRQMAKQMTGVDLSPGMIAQAQAKSLYDRLETGDLVSFLDEEARSDRRYDLVIAADVFVYFGDLTQICQSIACVLSPSGLFAFTLETHSGPGVFLGEKLRYAHAADYVRDALKKAGLMVCTINPASTRKESGSPVPGLIVVAAYR
ncbi:MAG TPA: methyltransferase domain-containing protein [Xanthobacteraceae bacterium]|nr:methyltransferase domain-containing protein [Xanthobacteraceae bacterium]